MSCDEAPSVSFSVKTSRGRLVDLILSGEKRQTIRRVRKRELKEGDTLHIFNEMRTPKTEKDMHRIGTAVIKSITRTTIADIKDDEQIARDDGFRDAAEMQRWFYEMGYFDSTIVDVITFGDFQFSEEVKKKL